MGTKSKISQSKRNNQKRNKLVKQGVIKKTSKISKKKDLKPKKVIKNIISNNENTDDDHDMLDMIEDDELNFLKKSVGSSSYSFLKSINRIENVPSKKRRKRKIEDESLEHGYEERIELKKPKTKYLLPIKTKINIIPQEIVVQDESTIENENQNINEKKPNINVNNENNSNDNSSDDDEKNFTFNLNTSEPLSVAQCLIARHEFLKQKKIHIGTLSAGVLENPEEKIINLRTLLNILDEKNIEAFFTIKKLVIVSLLEIFKDLLPSYEIKNNINTEVKLKKDVLKLHKYEEQLLFYYKKFLQKLEAILLKLKKKNKQLNDEEKQISLLSVQSLCSLLSTHPYFNYSEKIAQLIIPLLNFHNKDIREIVKSSVKTVFMEDKKKEISLKIVRIINSYMKNQSSTIHTDILEILLILNLTDINLDQSKQDNIKEKKYLSKKHKIIQLSRREKKRQKKLEALEKEMLETKGEESQNAKQKNLTEITKLLFGIYFRIIKSSNSFGILEVCLEGLAKFSHCINLEYYLEIVNVLDGLLKQDWLNYREKLFCIQTVFAIISGQGEALIIDPTRFYINFYKDLFLNNTTNQQDNCPIILNILHNALFKRRTKITNKRLLGFLKRLTTVSLQLPHHSALGFLCFVKNIMLVDKSTDILLDLDNSVGMGKFIPDLNDPEYSNACNTALYEMTLLNRHYHPVIKEFAKTITFGTTNSDKLITLSPAYSNLTPMELYTQFDMSEMLFNPQVPLPKMKGNKIKIIKNHQFVDKKFELYCKSIFNNLKLGFLQDK